MYLSENIKSLFYILTGLAPSNHISLTVSLLLQYISKLLHSYILRQSNHRIQTHMVDQMISRIPIPRDMHVNTI